MKTLKGKLTISRPQGSRLDDEPHISITLMDADSGCEAVEVRINLASFAEALTGMGHVACEFSWNDSGIIGKIREHKQVEVFIPDGDHHKSLSIIRAAIAEHEVDGWEGRDMDGRNSHRWTRTPPPKGKKGMWTMVTFERWVDPPAGGEQVK